MRRDLVIRSEKLPLKAPFRIARGVKAEAEVVVVELTAGAFTGRGECVPYPRYGESPQSVAAQLAPVAEAVQRGRDPEPLARALPPGAARNALDCALWDLEARRSGRTVAERLGVPAPAPLPSAVTISLDSPQAMAAAAAAAADAPLLKVKLDADDPAARLRAVAEAAPHARLILDPNESWTPDILMVMAPEVARLPVALVEQPLPADADQALAGLDYPAPICADESVHTTADLDRLAGRYGMVNVKLDKAGGLTEALALVRAARERGLGVMAGCMVASSLAIAPALLLAAEADVADLDGPWWLAADRPGGCRFERGVIHPPAPGFWGEPGSATHG